MSKKQVADDRPIPFSDTLRFVNDFTLNLASFLNKFSQNCEEKLNNIEISIQRMEITLCLLEAKLNSIEGLGSEPQQAQVPQASAQASTQNEENIPPPPPAPPLPGAQNEDQPPPPPPVQEEKPESNIPKCKDDPRLAKYFKMLRVRVPIENVKHKMRSDGIDDSIIDTPDAPSPFGPLTQEEMEEYAEYLKPAEDV